MSLRTSGVKRWRCAASARPTRRGCWTSASARAHAATRPLAVSITAASVSATSGRAAESAGETTPSG